MARVRGSIIAGILAVAVLSAVAGAQEDREIRNLRLAIEELVATHGAAYPHGAEFLGRLREVERMAGSARAERFRAMQREALLANPLLAGEKILVVKRKATGMKQLGFPTNHECNSSLPRDGYDNEIALLENLGGPVKSRAVYRPADGAYVGETDLHWDGKRLLFTSSTADQWVVNEIGIDGTGLRRVSRMPKDVDCFDACYLPDGKVIFGSTASYQAVPCWHGLKRVTNLYVMDGGGGNVRQLCFDQDHDLHPTVLGNGQVLYHRWDYTGINHIFMRQLMVMNPDGTGQRAVYGSNSWYPNSLYFPRPLPGDDGRIITILSGYHGVNRMGQLVLLDTARAWHEAEGIVQRISGRGEPVNPVIRDELVDGDWPKFLTPWPVSDQQYLVSAWQSAKGAWGIYLADAFDNLVLIHEEPGYALLEPVLAKARPVPPVVPDRVDRSRTDATVYLHDVHAGPGLAGVPRGTVKKLRIIAYHFGYPGMAGPDKIGRGGPWEAMRILGTVPLESDGSAMFTVPANTPLAVQPLDAEGKAVQLMRSWFTAMPGEVLSCVGCHERAGDAGPAVPAAAAYRQPAAIVPWHGPARGFDFAREVQPVLDVHCVSCHDGRDGRIDLRAEDKVPGYRGLPLSRLATDRLHPAVRAATGGVFRYTPAYETLIHHIRRVGIEDDVSLLVPGEYHADTSPLVQLLRKGHHGVKLTAENWDRIVTWIDLNAPCHGTWGEAHPIPDGAHERRMELRKLAGGPAEDPEVVPATARPAREPVVPRDVPAVQVPKIVDWPLSAEWAARRQWSADGVEMTLDLGEGMKLKLVRIPAGRFVMGDAEEGNPAIVEIDRPFWLGACEVTNAQYRRFDPGHDSRYYGRRHARSDDQGLTLNGDEQPAVRVSWEQAMAFCRWLSQRTGKPVTLPTDAQWEYACRAGTDTAMSYSHLGDDFSTWANVADLRFSRGLVKDGKQTTGGLEHLVLEGAALADARFDDGEVVTANVGRYRPNAWRLFDMHGNAAEWTQTDETGNTGRKIVRGGSFFDPPRRARSAWRTGYPAWQRPFNVGFRIAMDRARGT